MTEDVVLRVITKQLIPFILLFALYVQFHGDFGPGGGFQAGVLFGAGFMLYGMVFGVKTVERIFPVGAFRIGIAGGVLLYSAVGLAGVLLPGHFLDYNVLSADPKEGQHIGIMVIEFGVGVTVAAVMVATFYAFARPKA
jgi:multicomponent Na+:H+ antiporter subunit B